jgi:hypothetical protein
MVHSGATQVPFELHWPPPVQGVPEGRFPQAWFTMVLHAPEQDTGWHVPLLVLQASLAPQSPESQHCRH